MRSLSTIAGISLFADSLGVPREISIPFANKVVNLYRCNGEEWTVAFLKTIYTDFVRYLADLDPVGTWYKRSGDVPAGPFKPIFRIAKANPKTRHMYTQLLRCYTGVTSKKLTTSQWNKFYDGVSAKPVGIDLPHSEMLNEAVHRLGLRVQYGLPSPYYTYSPAVMRRVPDPSGRSVPEEDGWSSQHRFTKSELGSEIFQDFYPLFCTVLPHDIDMEVDESYPNVVGRIGLIQEPGLKLRAVANPNRVFQHALKPLGNALYSALRTLPWDCTHDQSKATVHVQEYLKRNQTAFCVDLAGATDYFPLELQKTVLRAVVRNDTMRQMELFFRLSRSPWLTPWGETVTWSKGQPLGLYPSFASFALTHGLCLYALNGFHHSNMFFVLGDDVIILDEGLHSKYRIFLSDIGCPISEAKCLKSSKMAEFAGKLITSDDVIHQLKWRQVSDDNFLDLLRNIGYDARRLLRPKQRLVAEVIQVIPDFLGGLGLNPKGLPLEDRVELYYKIQQPDRSKYLLSLSRRAQAYAYAPGKPPCFWEDPTLDAFDKKVSHLVLNLLRFSGDWAPVMGANLRTVDPDLGLPVETADGRRRTLLQTLSCKLGL